MCVNVLYPLLWTRCFRAHKPGTAHDYDDDDDDEKKYSENFNNTFTLYACVRVQFTGGGGTRTSGLNNISQNVH